MATIWDTHKNLSASTVATVPTPATSGTTLVLVDGSTFPAPSSPYNCLVWPASAIPTPSNSEIVRVTSLSTNTCTITRAQEGSVARAITVGDNFALTITKKNITDIETAVNTLETLTPDNGICDGRLTLTTLTPVTTADVTGATNIFWTPYTGNRVSLYNGTSWATLTFAEITIPLGTITSGLPYDIFVYNNSGVITCEILAWNNTTTRTTGLVLQDGILSKSGATTRRYLGTFYTTSTTQTEDSIAKRYLWNYYNRVTRPLEHYEATASWNYTTATIRQANGAATNQVEVVVGVQESVIDLNLNVVVNNSAGAVPVSVGIGEDSTTTFTRGWFTDAAVTLNTSTLGGRFTKFPAIGRHVYSWNEWSTAGTGTTTWFANYASAGGTVVAGIEGSIQG